MKALQDELVEHLRAQTQVESEAKELTEKVWDMLIEAIDDDAPEELGSYLNPVIIDSEREEDSSVGSDSDEEADDCILVIIASNQRVSS